MNLLILGSGTGGTIAAWTFLQRGQRVAVNVIHRAKVASYLRRSEEFGIAKEMSGSD